MPPAAKSKSKFKEQPSARASKEQQKASSKPSGSTNLGNGNPASAYNPISGTFHTLDTAPLTFSQPLQSNGRFQNIDETDTHSGSSHETAADYDSISNNGSFSGESEDNREKATSTDPPPEMIPGSDNDKREKIRQKNERKHHRQKERRAKELHERCCGYLMSRKLESLSQQLVAMGFSSERATLALILNEGKVEESVNWLFEGSADEAQKKDLGNEDNLKIDVHEELAQIAAMEVAYKLSKQDVERAVVACEGDLGKVEETLRAQKPEPLTTPPKPEEKANVKLSMRVQEKPTATVTKQPNRNDREINYVKRAVAGPTIPEPRTRSLQASKANQPMLLAEKGWPATGLSSSVSYAVEAPLQLASSSAKMGSQLRVSGNEGRTIQHGVMREPVIMMQRPQSQNMKQNSITSISASPPGTSGWYANTALDRESMKLSGKFLHNQSTGTFGPESLTMQHFNPQSQSTRSLGPDNLSSHPYYLQTPYTQHMSSSVDPAEARLGISWSAMGASSPSLKVPSSLGLFSGWGTTGTVGSYSHVDWNTGDMSHCDYNSIDWTLESKSSSLKSSGLMPGKSNALMLGLSSMRVASANGMHIPGLQDGGRVTEATSSVGMREWTSPFAGKDIFSVPREFVISPSP
ncbi:unnamed protein product [Ilex paraguariensis]|uniref:UBA domain-containing protein n=1 Tax=Ilex paraguariensis TaxID=185542 RepID=A0ABC8UAN6_9AQUA